MSFNADPTKQAVEKVQYQAAVTGCWQGSNKLYNELGWETLAHRQ